MHYFGSYICVSDDSCKRSRRVRSWYLYEQFKSLERSQLDAARQLKDKSYQERILRQELTERRARRRLCDQFGLCQSESKLGRSVNSKTLLTSSADDFYESFCRLHNDDVDMSSWDGSQSSKTYQECRLQYRDGIGNSDSVTSVLQNINQEDNLTDTVKEDLQIVQRDIVENINNQLETVRENIDYINEYTKMSDDGKLSDDSYNSVDECDKEKLADFVVLKESKCIFLTVLSAWSKLVEFSYRNMQINNWGV
ncbi:unnamed protein product [Leptosia nina]|uniref:t-SNARE coiled-coil homology domain-containing protein n=1 Tax=Leptosia nina TaxID=320188 RepID=A0AAV1JFJ6_9NEOP